MMLLREKVFEILNFGDVAEIRTLFGASDSILRGDLIDYLFANIELMNHTGRSYLFEHSILTDAQLKIAISINNEKEMARGYPNNNYWIYRNTNLTKNQVDWLLDRLETDTCYDGLVCGIIRASKLTQSQITKIISKFVNSYRNYSIVRDLTLFQKLPPSIIDDLIGCGDNTITNNIAQFQNLTDEQLQKLLSKDKFHILNSNMFLTRVQKRKINKLNLLT